MRGSASLDGIDRVANERLDELNGRVRHSGSNRIHTSTLVHCVVARRHPVGGAPCALGLPGEGSRHSRSPRCRPIGAARMRGDSLAEMLTGPWSLNLCLDRWSSCGFDQC
jgi:hypothetical protein